MFEINNAVIINGPSASVFEELLEKGVKMIATFEMSNNFEVRKIDIPIRVIRKIGHEAYFFTGRAGNFEIKGEYAPRLCGVRHAGKVNIVT